MGQFHQSITIPVSLLLVLLEWAKKNGKWMPPLPDGPQMYASGILLSQPNFLLSKLGQAISPTHRLKSLWETKRRIFLRNTVPPQPSHTLPRGCTHGNANEKQHL